MGSVFQLAHVSDLHATPVAPGGLAPLLGKRAFGWLSWQLRRRHAHRAEVLEALLRDLDETRPDHVVVTGDLTNVSLPGEFELARGWLERLGAPERVTAVPGNHDAYVAVPEADSWAHWSAYLASDAPGRALLDRASGVEDGEVPAFPSLRVLPGIALVGLCSARPTALFQASGALGAAQLERLDAVLRALAERGLSRVLLIHHPPAEGVVSRRRALRDAKALGDVLRGAGAELVLHGHLHRTRVGSLPGPGRPIPVVGVRSASHVDARRERLAGYHVYRIEARGAPGTAPRITLHARAYDPDRGAFRGAGPPDGRVLTADPAGGEDDAARR